MVIKKKMVMNDAIMIYAGKLKRNSINDNVKDGMKVG